MLDLPILYYHHIAPPPPGCTRPNIYVEPARFARQLRLLKFLGYRSLSFDCLVDHLEAGTRPECRSILLTFDDGHENNATAALPLLQEYGFSATIFVTAGFVGRRLVLRSSTDPRGEPIVTAEQIRRLVDAGIDIQSHGMTHRNLADIPLAEAREEIFESRRVLEDLTGRPVRTFCYPYGSFKPAHLEMVAEAGYRAAVSTVRGRLHAPEEHFCLKRIPVHHHQNLLRFIHYLRFKSYARAGEQLDRLRTGRSA